MIGVKDVAPPEDVPWKARAPEKIGTSDWADTADTEHASTTKTKRTRLIYVPFLAEMYQTRIVSRLEILLHEHLSASQFADYWLRRYKLSLQSQTRVIFLLSCVFGAILRETN